MVMIMTLDLRVAAVIEDLTVMALDHQLAVIVVIVVMILDLQPVVVQGLRTVIALDLQVVVTVVADPVLRPNVIQGLRAVIVLDLQLAVIVVMNPVIHRIVFVFQGLHTVVALDLQSAIIVVMNSVLHHIPFVFQGLHAVVALDLQLAMVVMMNPVLRLIVVNQGLHTVGILDLHQVVIIPLPQVLVRLESSQFFQHNSQHNIQVIVEARSRVLSLVDTRLELKSLADDPIVHPVILVIELLCAIPLMMALQIATILVVDLRIVAVDTLQYTDFPGIAIVAHLTDRLALCRQNINTRVIHTAVQLILLKVIPLAICLYPPSVLLVPFLGAPAVNPLLLDLLMYHQQLAQRFRLI